MPGPRHNYMRVAQTPGLPGQPPFARHPFVGLSRDQATAIAGLTDAGLTDTATLPEDARQLIHANLNARPLEVSDMNPKMWRIITFVWMFARFTIGIIAFVRVTLRSTLSATFVVDGSVGALGDEDVWWVSSLVMGVFELALALTAVFTTSRWAGMPVSLGADKQAVTHDGVSFDGKMALFMWWIVAATTSMLQFVVHFELSRASSGDVVFNFLETWRASTQATTWSVMLMAAIVPVVHELRMAEIYLHKQNSAITAGVANAALKQAALLEDLMNKTSGATPDERTDWMRLAMLAGLTHASTTLKHADDTIAANQVMSLNEGASTKSRRFVAIA